MEENVPDSNPPIEYNSFAKGFLLGNMNVDGRVHTDERSFICSICEKTFMSNSNLKRHLRIHTGEKPSECEICKKRFLRESTLKMHMRIHTGEKPYECDICQKTFSQQGNLKKHKKLHTGERPYECSVCKKDFIQEVHLKSHMRVHTGEKPYECNVCNRRFSQNDLKRHMRVHTGEKLYECKLCKRNFTRQCYLKIHMRLHTGEKPYECDVCKRKFALKSHVKRHMKLHTGEKCHECDICKRVFSLKCNLTEHMRDHTDEKPYESENVVILPSGSLENSEDTQLVSEAENVICMQEEISDEFDSGDCSDRRGESHDDSEEYLDESVRVDRTALFKTGDGSSHMTSRDIDKGSGDGYSLKIKTEDVLQCPEQVVETVFDDNVDCHIKIERSDSPNNVYSEQKQQSQTLEDLDCIKNNDVEGYIDERKGESDCSTVNLADKTYRMNDQNMFDIHRVYVVESKNRASPIDEDKNIQHHLPDDIVAMPKKENDESMSSLIIKEEPKFL